MIHEAVDLHYPARASGSIGEGPDRRRPRPVPTRPIERAILPARVNGEHAVTTRSPETCHNREWFDTFLLRVVPRFLDGSARRPSTLSGHLVENADEEGFREACQECKHRIQRWVRRFIRSKPDQPCGEHEEQDHRRGRADYRLSEEYLPA